MDRLQGNTVSNRHRDGHSRWYVMPISSRTTQRQSTQWDMGTTRWWGHHHSPVRRWEYEETTSVRYWRRLIWHIQFWHTPWSGCYQCSLFFRLAAIFVKEKYRFFYTIVYDYIYFNPIITNSFTIAIDHAEIPVPRMPKLNYQVNF